MTKTCDSCGKSKPLTAFWRQVEKNGNVYYRRTCGKCIESRRPSHSKTLHWGEGTAHLNTILRTPLV